MSPDDMLLFELLEETKEYNFPLMENNEFKACLKRSKVLGNKKYVHDLPPGKSINVFSIDSLPGCPEEWVRGPGSYVCPVNSGWGLWFDWTMNDAYNTAVLPSVKGMNPITGKKLKSLGLEQYTNRCPGHRKPFKHNRYCSSCKYEWPPQNYISYPNKLWLDGFRKPDGTVNQFVFTERMRQEMIERDVPTAAIGERAVERAGMSFGFAFYETKIVKNINTTFSFLDQSREGYPRVSGYSGYSGYSGLTGLTGQTGAVGSNRAFAGYTGSLPVSGYSGFSGISSTNTCINIIFEDFDVSKSSNYGASGFSGIMGGFDSYRKTGTYVLSGLSGTSGDPDPSGFSLNGLRRYELNDKHRLMAIESGSKIQQEIHQSYFPVTEWKETPSAIIRLYFVFPEELIKILTKGGISQTKTSS